MMTTLAAAATISRRRPTSSAGTIGKALRTCAAVLATEPKQLTLPASSSAASASLFREFSSDDKNHTYFPGSSLSDTLAGGSPPPAEQEAWQAKHNIDIQRVTQIAMVGRLQPFMITERPRGPPASLAFYCNQNTEPNMALCPSLPLRPQLHL